MPAMERYRVFDISSEEELESESERGSQQDVAGPAPAAIARQRSLPKNKSLKPRAVRSERSLKQKSILSRTAEFPGEGLEMRDGALFCGLCKDWQSEKKSSVAARTKSRKHAVSKEKAKKDRLREQSVMQALSKQKESIIVGEILPSQQRAYRVRVVKAFYEKAFHWPR